MDDEDDALATTLANSASMLNNESHQDATNESETGSILSCGENSVCTIEEFKDLMYKVQAARRKIVVAIVDSGELLNEWIEVLQKAANELTNAKTKFYQRELRTLSTTMSINIKDEIIGLKKDLIFLEHFKSECKAAHTSWQKLLSEIDLTSLLAKYHPISEEAFRTELENVSRLLHHFIVPNASNRKPIFITDWDGTMKDYCSQYITNFQPIYSAVGMTMFASRFTRLSAVLTAGPLSGPGILDLTAMTIDGPVLFSGSWGREWWLGGQRIVHDDGISREGFDALEKFDAEMNDLLTMDDFSLFALVGSGVQRKVDRLTLGVQTVFGCVKPELSSRYQTAVKGRVDRVDPNHHILVCDPTTDLEVEVVAHSSGKIWNKADGMDRVVAIRGQSLTDPGMVLICGDTHADLPMIRRSVALNPEGTLAILVGRSEKLRECVRDIVVNDDQYCFVSCPDVVHAAIAQLLKE